ncbi:alpha-mannosidase [Cryobacterium tepidiphilum]|uniref:Alpha-mannosidase n=1 Tax=Cryobacterium tepidiphilum TaxID=2486026 RepID=A0A3M8LBF1_9MICO|nr:glycoside hydrolase family 38 C-terminal domain-containing protein [Cryobacterium tepidiphilum]RNE62655.1 alpha-mannosidase [Cryobacterium tepidiphilum]
MHDDSARVQARLDRFVRERMPRALYRAASPLTIEAWEAPGEPVPFAEAVRQDFRPFAAGTDWGRAWGTTWFHLTGVVPDGWAAAASTGEVALEAVVDLGFTAEVPGFQVEGTAYTADGAIVKAVESFNRWLPLSPGGPIDLYIEAASNPDIAQAWTFTPTPDGDLATARPGHRYTFRQADVALRDIPVWELAQDIWTLDGLLRELPLIDARRADLVRALDRCLDAVDPDDVAGTASAGRAELAGVLASPATASAHRLHAVGHAHIDSAWLWPTRETVRKVARTFSNVLALVEENPDFVFAASSAQQYAWLKEHYPELFERVRAAVAAGSIVPVGGMWVESDTNLPGGEALVRQFVAGKRFFLEEFGVEPEEVWLPDSFGYSGSVPQIAAAAGMRWFLTQKLSWNDTNVFPHHTFRWEGLDGTRIFTHFPPVADYNAQLSGAELARAARVFAEKGHANTSLIPFGWGDGGGGPTREMIAAARRTASLEGSPSVTLSSPRRFFEAAEAEYPAPPVWSGELYLEFHRGTYTSQARTKRGNRRSEHLLREAEVWAATASVRGLADYPYDALETAWHTVLLQQFHDILPGSSIAWVHREAERNYAALAVTLEGLIESALRALAGSGAATLVANAGPYALEEVPALGGAPGDRSPGEGSHVDLPEAAGGRFAIPHAAGAASATRVGESIRLRNDRVLVVIDADGLFTSVMDLANARELLAEGARGNLPQLHRDVPAKWDAWDLDANYRRTVTDLTAADSVAIVSDGSDGYSAHVRVERSVGASRITQDITLAPGRAAIDIGVAIDWHERQKLLKLAFPLDVHADRAASEIQFGHVFRPTHTNTSWDAARFETVAHRWVHVGEPGYGVAIANDASYGHDITRTTDAAGHPATTVRLSLLRAPLYPDPDADQGEHRFRVALGVGAGIPDAVAEGYRLNLPLRTLTGVADPSIEPLFSIDNPAVVIEAVKLAEDRSGDVVVRLYEAHGSRALATLIRSFDAADATETDLLERPLGRPRAVVGAAGAETTLELRPFQLVTLRFARRS